MLRRVAYLACDPTSGPRGHDTQTKMSVARSIAALLDAEYLGQRSSEQLSSASHEGTLLVPSDTIVGPDIAAALGIGSACDLFGGVVPFSFVATKLITHPLIADDAAAPRGWDIACAQRNGAVVLPGYSAFNLGDALEACRRLLQDGRVRVKHPDGIGGAGQYVVGTVEALKERLAGMAADALREGVVLERNLEGVTTRSVGQVRLGPWFASYHGIQQLTRNHHGHEVYGGSALTVVRGGYDALLELPLDESQRSAIEQARVYDKAARASYPGMTVSRSNYDVVEGIDDDGRHCSGVLEQSWRIGGASGAELAALHAFKDDPSLHVIDAATCEIYGEGAAIPPGARVHYDGIDPKVGRLTKFATTKPHAHL